MRSLFFTKPFGFPFLFLDEGAGGGGAGPAPKTFTQEELNRIAGDARAEGRTTAEKELLAKFKVEKVDDLAALVQAARDADARNKTELEKLQQQVTDKDAELTKVQSESEQTISGLKARILNSEIKQQAAAQILDKDGKTVIRAAFRPDALDDVITLIDKKLITEKDDKYEGIDKALAELAKGKPYLLAAAEKPTGKGTPRIDESKKTNVENKTPAKSSGMVVRL